MKMYKPSDKHSQNNKRAVAAGVSKRQGKGQSAMQIDDRRPRDPIHQAIKQRVIQRMAVMTVDDFNNQKDPLVWNNLKYAETQATGPIGDLQTNKVWDQLDDNEEIRLVEHGEVKKIGNVSASDIAASMLNEPNKIPDNKAIGGITFQSCYAGVNGGGGSLVTDMADELKKMGRSGVTINGRTGIAFGFKGMGEQTAETDQSPYVWINSLAKIEFQKHLASSSSHANEKGFQAYFDAMWELRSKKTNTTNKNIFKRLFTYNDPWEMLNVSKIYWNTMTPQDRAANVADEMEDYWKNLSVSMAAKGGFKPDRNAVVSAVSKKKSRCFLTTACTEARGLPDDCRELTVLRAFRDGYMHSLKDGTSLIREYYAIAPQIVARIKDSREAKKSFASLYDEITTCVSLIENGYNHDALSMYKNMVMRLKDKWL